MSFLRRLVFNLWYLRRPPWDSGISPPELLQFIESHPPGRAIDIGCGTGTNVITLARAGWQVTGIDFIPRAIQMARKKTARAGIKADLRVGDASKLRGVRGPFNLALDIGCFHGLTDKKVDYFTALDRVLAPGGFWMMYGFFKSDPGKPGTGLVALDLESVPGRWQLISRQDGYDRVGRDSAWVQYQKKPSG